MVSNNPPRAYSAAHFALELDSQKSVGFIKSIEGGGVSAEVISYQMGDSYAIWRQLGRPKYEDIKLTLGMTSSFDFLTWISEFFQGNGTRRNGAIVAADFHYNEQARREFADALITEVGFPKVEGSDKSAAYATITIAPERIDYVRGSGNFIGSAIGDWKAQQLWTACNFDFTIDGFDSNLIRVTKVDAFSVKQKVIEYPAGDQGVTTKVPGRIEYPNITFYVPEVDAQPLVDDYLSYAEHDEEADGGHGGQIAYKDNAGNVLFTLEFFGGHIKSCSPEKHDASADEIKLVKFEMAIESMKFDGGSGGGGGFSIDVSVGV